MRISSSEISTWKRCRRQWDLTSVNRQGLIPKRAQKSYFAVGQAIHVGLAAQALKEDPTNAVYEYWKDNVGVGIDDENYQLVKGLLFHYFNYWGWKRPLKPLKYVAVELAFRVPIPNTRGYLVGTFDGIAVDVERRKAYIVDHKTYTQQPKLDNVERSEQFAGYGWAYSILFNEMPAGVVYDGLRKRLPVVPTFRGGRLEVPGKGMTSASYRAAVKEHGLREEDYGHEIMRLKAGEQLEQTEYFTRWRIRHTSSQLQSYEEHLVDTYRDMSSDSVRIYPTIPWNSCWDCSVQDVCDALERREDAQLLIDSRYERSEGYGSIRAQELTPHTVKRLSDLKRVMEGRSKDDVLKSSLTEMSDWLHVGHV